MFNTKHYVPILRWKTAEKEALKELSQTDKEYITPLLELIMPPRVRPKKGEKNKTDDDHNTASVDKLKVKIPSLSSEILKYWGVSPIFVDLSLFLDSSLKIWGYEEIMEGAVTDGTVIVPVIRLDDNLEVEKCVVSLAKKYKTGLSMRVLRSDLTAKDLNKKINAFLSKNSLKKEEVDLIVDIELVEDMTESEYSSIAEHIKNIPDLQSWRTFTVAAGAFPFDLTQFKANGTYWKSRSDWNHWLRFIYSGKLGRKASFGDYTIQHPIYVEPSPGANPSASIRYTAEETWVIMRGEALIKPNGPGHSQYPSQAQLLTQQSEFKGKDFSYGDGYIYEKAQDIDTKKTGSPRTWLRAGVNHHLALVARQIANLS